MRLLHEDLAAMAYLRGDQLQTIQLSPCLLVDDVLHLRVTLSQGSVKNFVLSKIEKMQSKKTPSIDLNAWHTSAIQKKIRLTYSTLAEAIVLLVIKERESVREVDMDVRVRERVSNIIVIANSKIYKSG